MSIIIGTLLFLGGFLIGAFLFSSDNVRLYREYEDMQDENRQLRFELDSKNYALNKLGHRIGTQRRKLRESRKLVEQYREACKAPTVQITRNTPYSEGAVTQIVGGNNAYTTSVG